jgi:predicted ABC-type ATPase
VACMVSELGANWRTKVKCDGAAVAEDIVRNRYQETISEDNVMMLKSV